MLRRVLILISTLVAAYWLGFIAISSLVANNLFQSTSIFYISLSLLSLFFLDYFRYKFAINRIFNTFRQSSYLSLYAFIVYFSILYIFNPQEPYSQNMGSVLLAFISIIVAIFLSTQQFRYKSFIYAYVALGLISIVVLNALFDLSELNIQNRDSISETLYSFNPITISRFASFLFLFTMFSIFYNKSVSFRILGGLLGVFSVIIIIISASRGALFAIIISMLIFGLYHFNLKRKLVYIGIICLLGVIIFANYSIEDTHMYSRMQMLIEGGVSSEARWKIYNEAIILSKNSIFDPKGYKHFTNLYGMYPHNIIIESIVNYGIIGLVLICYMIYTGLISCIEIFKKFNLSIIYMSIPVVWIFILISSMFSGDIVINYRLFVFYVLVIGLNNSSKHIK